MKYSFKGSELKEIVIDEIKRYFIDESLKENDEHEEYSTPEMEYQYYVIANSPDGNTPVAELKTVDIEDAVEEAVEWTKKGYILDTKLTSKEVLQQVSQDPNQDEPHMPEETDVEEPSYSYIAEELGEAGTVPIVKGSPIVKGTPIVPPKKKMTTDLQLMYKTLTQHLGVEKFMSEFLRIMNPNHLREVLEQLAKLYQVKMEESKVLATGKQNRPGRQEFIRQTHELVKQQMPNLSMEDFMRMESPNGMFGKVGPQFYYFQTNDTPQETANRLLQHSKKQEDTLEEKKSKYHKIT